MRFPLQSFPRYLVCPLLRLDYTANSSFLSTQSHQNLRPGSVFTCYRRHHWKLLHFITIRTRLSLSPTPGLEYAFMCTHVRHQQRPRMSKEVHVCECVCRRTTATTCLDRGALSRDFPPPRSIISQPTARGERDGRRADFPQTKAKPGGDLLGYDKQQVMSIDVNTRAMWPPKCLVLKIPSFCPFLPLSFLSSPTSPACIPDMPQGDRGGLQDRQTKTHNTHTHNTLTMALAAAIVCVH